MSHSNDDADPARTVHRSTRRRFLAGVGTLAAALSVASPSVAQTPPPPKAFGTTPLPSDAFRDNGAAPNGATPGGPAEAGVTDREVRFGITAPFSGPSRELGRQMKLGLDTAFALANDAGGIAGRRLALISADDGYDPDRALENMKLFHDRDHVFGVVGNVGTPMAALTLPYALANKMLFFTPFTGAAFLRNVPPDRYVFNYRPSYAEETEAVVSYLMRVKGFKAKEIAVFAQDDAYGKSGLDGVSRALRAAQGGFSEPGLVMNYQRNTVDVAQAMAQMRATKSGAIKAVIMVATYRAAAKFIEFTRVGFPKLVYTNVSFVGSNALSDELTLLGPSYAEGVLVTQVVPPVDGYSKAVIDYKAALAKYFPGERPDYVSFEGYIDGLILVEGLRRTGHGLTLDALVTALEGMHDFDLGLGVPLSFSASDHQASHKVWGTVLDKAGHYTPIDLL